MDERKIDWRGSSYKDLCAMPAAVRQTFGYALGLAQNNLPYADAKTLGGFRPALVELLEYDDGDTYRAVYTARSRTSSTCFTASRRSRPAAATCRSGTRKRSRRASPR